MRKHILSAALVGATLFTSAAFAGKVNPDGLAGAGVTGGLISTDAVQVAISDAIAAVPGGDVATFIAKLADVPGVVQNSGGGASFALNVDGVVYDVTISGDGEVTVAERKKS